MASLSEHFGTTLKMKGDTEVERLLKENQDLKRQLASATIGAASQIPYSDLEVQDQIGGGGFSLVYRGLWCGAPVAIKKWFDPQMSDQLVQEFRAEVMTMQALRHPNIVQFLGACSTVPDLAMVTEYMPTSLHAVLYTSNTQLDRARIIQLSQDIARSFIYLHSRSPMVIHRDLKPGNLLLDRAWKVKLCDFGLASASRATADHILGTPAYMAPELLDPSRGYNEKVDVYAFGVLLNEMLTKQAPWQGAAVTDIISKVTQGERPTMSLSAPRHLQDLINKCWSQSPQDRPTFTQVLQLLKEAAAAGSTA